MTEYELRIAYVGRASTYLGMKGMTDRMQVMCDTYNSKLSEENERWNTRTTRYIMSNQMRSGWGWCGVFVSAVGEELTFNDADGNAVGFDTFIPVEMGLYEYVKIAKNFGLWREKTYSPKGGDIVLYKWVDANGNATTSNPYDHIEVVEGVNDGVLQTIGGNNGAKPGVCSRRNTRIDDASIVGYVAPDYASAAAKTIKAVEHSPEPVTTEIEITDDEYDEYDEKDELVDLLKNLEVGDMIEITGKHDGLLDINVIMKNKMTIPF